MLPTNYIKLINIKIKRLAIIFVAFLTSCLCLPVADALSAGADINVGYSVPVTCALANLPTSVNLSILSTETGLYTTNFAVNCNTSNSIGLILSSTNQIDGGARLLSSSGNYLNYTVAINNIVYTMGQSNMLVPNISNSLRINIAKPTYAGQYQDTLVFTLSY